MRGGQSLAVDRERILEQRPDRGRIPPRLEPLGAWRALTLQQSVPIGPGGYGAG
ncbi:MAG: hypothetical protein ACOC8B_08360 [Gemmatimonadota bacterium]